MDCRARTHGDSSFTATNRNHCSGELPADGRADCNIPAIASTGTSWQSDMIFVAARGAAGCYALEARSVLDPIELKAAQVAQGGHFSRRVGRTAVSDRMGTDARYRSPSSSRSSHCHVDSKRNSRATRVGCWLTAGLAAS
jgi:hypothetical protein